jgi:hypothetical protein
MYPETYYNINEMGPENVYAGGAISRNPNPMTIDGRTGYVEPNIEGRGLGGFLKKALNPFSKEGVGMAVGSLVDPIGGYKIATGKDRTINKILGENNKPTGFVDGTNPAATGGGTDIDTTQGMDFNFRTDPGYQFRFEEGQRALYGQGFASNEYTNVYNRIANIAGLGQTANQFAGNAALQAGFGMGGAASAQGINSAYGAIGSGNAWANAGNAIASLPWDTYFGGGNKQPPNNYGFGDKWTGP